jgi:amidase
VSEIPWRDEKEQEVLDVVKAGSGGQLVFAIMPDDGVVRPHPPVRRALDIVVKTIEKLGHKVVEWNPPSHARCNDLVVCLLIVPKKKIKLKKVTQFKIWAFDGGEDSLLPTDPDQGFTNVYKSPHCPWARR